MNRLKSSRNELLNQFSHWSMIRNRNRNLLTELQAHPRRQRQQLDWPSRLYVATLGIVAAPVTLGLSLGITAAALFGNLNVEGEEIFTNVNNLVHHTIDEDRKASQELKAKEDDLGKCVADFAVFCREHIDSVLSSELVEDEFRFLLDIPRGTRSHGAAAEGAAPRPTLLHEEVNIHSRGSTLLERLQRSTSNQEALMITEQILDELQEAPNDDEIQRRITNFMETKFAEA